jgi:hypothetical protein
MNPEQETFEELRRLLVLKRYEQPPPGYFNDFSHQVIARIRAGERIGEHTFFARLGGNAPWLRRLWSALETKPALAGAFGAGVCGVLLAGVLYSQTVAPAPVTAFSDSIGQNPPMVAATPATPVLGPVAGYDLSNTGEVVAAQMRASLFQRLREAQPFLQEPRIERASFNQPIGGN